MVRDKANNGSAFLFRERKEEKKERKERESRREKERKKRKRQEVGNAPPFSYLFSLIPFLTFPQAPTAAKAVATLTSGAAG